MIHFFGMKICSYGFRILVKLSYISVPKYCCCIDVTLLLLLLLWLLILLLLYQLSKKINQWFFYLQYQLSCCCIALPEKETVQLLLWTICLRKSISDLHHFTKRERCVYQALIGNNWIGVFTESWSLIHNRISSSSCL